MDYYQQRKLKAQLKQRKISVSKIKSSEILSENEPCPIKMGDWTYGKSLKIIRVIASVPAPEVRSTWFSCRRLKRRAWRFDFYLLRDKKVTMKSGFFFHEDLVSWKKLEEEDAKKEYQLV